MPPSNLPTGLGILPLEVEPLVQPITVSTTDSLGSLNSGQWSTHVISNTPSLDQKSLVTATLRSTSAMKGLLRAEVGDSMVELDSFGGGSGFREGRRIALEAITPGGSSRHEKTASHDPIHQPQQTSLSRHGTLLTVGATPERNAAELKSILGGSGARLKHGAALLPVPGQPPYPEGAISLEQAKSRARVGVDIILHSNTCVQGGYLQGHVKVFVRKHSKDESPVAISEGKIRVIGFESISNENDRYPFYQCSAPFSTVTATSDGLYESPRDYEGFAHATHGAHVLPFSMYLPLSADHGTPKGTPHTQSGVAIRYIAIVSIKVKDSHSGRRSIAHFYRNCEIWPRLNPSIILAPAPKPLQMSTSKSLFMGGSGKVDLVASLHRLHWIAGQQCYVKVSVINSTKKTIKSLTLSLYRSTIVFKPDRRLDAPCGDQGMDPDACQTSTTQKQVAESILEMGQRGTKGHASAKGWWTGVGPGEKLNFSHFILIPPDALSITRSRLLEVEYSLRVTLSAGTLPTADVQVTLPIRIVNFLSVDPPPSFQLTSQEDLIIPSINTSDIAGTYVIPRPQNVRHSRPMVTGLFGSYGSNSRTLEPLGESDDEYPHEKNPSTLDDDINNSIDSGSYDRYHEEGNHESQIFSDSDEELDNLSMYEDDQDEVAQYTIPRTRLDPEYCENAPRFADLYYASIQEGCHQETLGFSTGQNSGDTQQESHTKRTTPGNLQDINIPEQQTQHHPDTCGPDALTRPNRPRGPSSFTQRVQEKMEAAVAQNANGFRSRDLTQESDIRTTVNEELQEHLEDDSNYSSTNGSYFSAQNSLEQATRDDHDPMASLPTVRPSTARGPSDLGYYSAFPPSPIPESVASSAFRAVSEYTNNGSRILPQPPLAAKSSLASDTAETSLPGLPLADADLTTISNTNNTEAEVNGGSSACMRLSRPSLVTDVGSASSVKDKIREFEQRVKAMESSS